MRCYQAPEAQPAPTCGELESDVFALGAISPAGVVGAAPAATGAEQLSPLVRNRGLNLDAAADGMPRAGPATGVRRHPRRIRNHPNALLSLGDYKAKQVKNDHWRGAAYDSYEVYEVLLPDKNTRRFIVVGQSE